MEGGDLWTLQLQCSDHFIDDDDDDDDDDGDAVIMSPAANDPPLLRFGVTICTGWVVAPPNGAGSCDIQVSCCQQHAVLCL